MKVLIALSLLVPFLASATQYDLKAYTHYHAEREKREDEHRLKCRASNEIVRNYQNTVIREFAQRHGSSGAELDSNRQFRVGSLDCQFDDDRYRPMIVCYTSAQLPPIIEVINKRLPTVNYDCDIEYPQTSKQRSKR